MRSLLVSLLALLLLVAVPAYTARTILLQCSAITKTTGQRCKRTVTVPEGTKSVLCWQHDPARRKAAK